MICVISTRLSDMKKLFFTFLTLLLASLTGRAEETLFPYPTVPEGIETLNERANYAVSHFWDKFPFNRPIADEELLGQAMYDYIMFLSLADDQPAFDSVDKLLESLSKDPQKLLTFGYIAQDLCYVPSAPFLSDELYLRFADAVAGNKKIKSADKSSFASHITTIRQTRPGDKAPNLRFVKPDGSKTQLDDYYGKYIILFFNDPACSDCNLARVRLSADININEHIKNEELLIISVYPYAPDDTWRKAAERYNPAWLVVASDKADEIYDLRNTPSIYYLNPSHKILSKEMTVDQMIDGFRNINTKKATE